MASPLPQFVVLKSKSNGKYLRYVEEENGETYLQFCGEDVFSSDVKFEIQDRHHVPAANQGSSQPGRPRQGPSRHGTSQHGHANRAKFVHIRCCYNNRYLVGVADNWIVAEAEEPETDTSKSSCTLVEPITTDADTKTFQFRHVQLNHSLSIDEDTNTLSADPTKPIVECKVIDSNSLSRLPKRVVFKDDRGYYLRHHDHENHWYMEFAENDRKGQGILMEEVVVKGDGYVQIKYHDSHGRAGRFWRCDRETKRIRADSESDPGNDIDDALFLPVQIDDKIRKTFALRNKYSNWFCRRLGESNKFKRDYLCVAGDSITKEAHLVVEEPLTSRRVEKVEFRLEHARIDKITDVTVVSQEATNASYTENVSQQLKLLYKLEESYTLSSSTQSKSGYRATFTAGIPKFVNGKLEISSEDSGSFQWGEPKTKSVGFESTHTVNVKPRTIAIARVSATRASYHVPFSCIQHDTLRNGNEVSDKIEDGVFSAVAWLDIKDYNDDKTIDATHNNTSSVIAFLKKLWIAGNIKPH